MKKTIYFHNFNKLSLLLFFCLFFISFNLNCQEKLYWVTGDPDLVMQSNLDGSEATVVTADLVDPTGLAIDTENENLYLGLAGEADAVVRVSFDGTQIETLISAESGVSAIQLDLVNGKIYYSLFEGGKIKRADLDGSNIETIVDPAASPNDFFIDFAGGKIYWTEYFDGFIKRCDLDGIGTETLISGQLYPCHLFLDETNNKMFWTNYIGNNINSANLDGTDHQVILSGLSYPTGITLDLNNDHIYWVNFNAKNIQRADLDGTNITTIYTSNEPDIVMWTLKSSIQNINSSHGIVEIIPLELHQNFPNPFNPTTTITFTLNTENTEDADLIIYNLKGQKIKTFPVILSGVEGQSSIVWNGTDQTGQPVSSGMYFYKLSAGSQTLTRKMVLLK